MHTLVENVHLIRLSKSVICKLASFEKEIISSFWQFEHVHLKPCLHVRFFLTIICFEQEITVRFGSCKSFKALFTRAIFLDDFLYMHLHIIGSVTLSQISVRGVRGSMHLLVFILEISFSQIMFKIVTVIHMLSRKVFKAIRNQIFTYVLVHN